MKKVRICQPRVSSYSFFLLATLLLITFAITGSVALAQLEGILPEIEKLVAEKYGGKIVSKSTSLLGQGTFGSAYKLTITLADGYQIINKEIVVKVPGGATADALPPEIAEAALMKDRVALEIAAEKNIKGFPKYIGSIESGGKIRAVVMEYVEGIPYTKFIKIHPEVEELLLQKLIKLLKDFEKKGLRVWDPNFSNFLVEPGGTLVLVDAGSAMPADEVSFSLLDILEKDAPPKILEKPTKLTPPTEFQKIMPVTIIEQPKPISEEILTKRIADRLLRNGATIEKIPGGAVSCRLGAGGIVNCALLGLTGVEIVSNYFVAEEENKIGQDYDTCVSILISGVTINGQFTKFSPAQANAFCKEKPLRRDYAILKYYFENRATQAILSLGLLEIKKVFDEEKRMNKVKNQMIIKDFFTKEIKNAYNEKQLADLERKIQELKISGRSELLNLIKDKKEFLKNLSSYFPAR